MPHTPGPLVHRYDYSTGMIRIVEEARAPKPCATEDERYYNGKVFALVPEDGEVNLIAAAPTMLKFIRLALKNGLFYSTTLEDEARVILRDVEGESHG